MSQTKNFYVANSYGRILRSGFCPEQDFGLQASGHDEFLFEGFANPITQYVKNGVLVDRPSQPSQFHDWDFDRLEWVEKLDEAMAGIRSARNMKLRASDWVESPSALERLSVEEMSAWLDYRQALRDMTNGIDLANVVWPIAPNAGSQPIAPPTIPLTTYE
jgi:hypothetical protein